MTGKRLALVLALFAAACTPKRIPGTDIDDTDDTRAILDVMNRYRAAMEAKDAAGVVALVADSFKDDGGNANPEDDLDYARLREKLPEELGRFQDVRLDMTVKKIEVHKDGSARAVYSYNSSFKMPGLTARALSDSDIKEMWLKRVGKEWKITSGL